MDTVEKDCLRRSVLCEPVDVQWTVIVHIMAPLWTTFARPQAEPREAVVTHRFGAGTHMLTSVNPQPGDKGHDRRPQSYPQGVDDEDDVRVSGWSRADNETTGLWTALWISCPGH